MHLTVLIPTKNRQRTAIQAVASALALQGDDVEVVVQDCGDDSRLGDLLPTDPRLKYTYDASSRSMADNWNAGLARATGTFVTVIGDDDAVLPELLPTARWAHAKRLDSVTFPHSAYFWPDFPGTRASQLAVQPFTGAISQLDPEYELKSALSSTAVFVARLPQVYHGLVRRDLLLNRPKGIRPFETLAPDYFSAISAACLTPKYVYFDFPLIVGGASGPSNSARTVVGTVGLHFQEYALAWPDYLPPPDDRTKTTDLIVAQAVTQALEINGRLDLLALAPFERYFGLTLIRRPSDWQGWIKSYQRYLQRWNKSPTESGRRLLIEAVQAGARKLRSSVIDRLPAQILKMRGYQLTEHADLRLALDEHARWVASTNVPFYLPT